jgi:hypothetical protein
LVDSTKMNPKIYIFLFCPSSPISGPSTRTSSCPSSYHLVSLTDSEQYSRLIFSECNSLQSEEGIMSWLLGELPVFISPHFKAPISEIKRISFDFLRRSELLRRLQEKGPYSRRVGLRETIYLRVSELSRFWVLH